MPPDERLARGYSSGAISAAAVVKVTSARFIGPASSDAHPWRATAKVERLLQGSYPGRTLSFERGWGSAACDDGRPPPKAGERWVIYFWAGADGEQAVWQSYPLDVALAADPRIDRARR